MLRRDHAHSESTHAYTQNPHIMPQGGARDGLVLAPGLVMAIVDWERMWYDLVSGDHGQAASGGGASEGRNTCTLPAIRC